MSFTWWWYPTRRFAVGNFPCAVAMRARGGMIESELTICGLAVACDAKPVMGPGASDNHRLTGPLPDGRMLSVEAGYASVWTTGVVARMDDVVVYESHLGRTIAFPESLKASAESSHKAGAFAPKNSLPIAIDILTGLLFFVVAKATDLTTAALAGVAVGVALVVYQRITKIDVTGGLALFGIAMLCISAALALAFHSDDWVKMRGTITGMIAATLFLTDGLLGGKRLAIGLTRYLPFPDIDPGRLGIGMGVLGLFMAALNYVVARIASTDIWLFYTTFLDIFIVMALAYVVVNFARGKARAAP
jgi:intracellular septation protein A